MYIIFATNISKIAISLKQFFLDRSDTSDGCAAPIPGEVSGEDESAAMMSDDHAPVSPCESNDTDDTTYFMPWIKVILFYYLFIPTISRIFIDIL